MLFQSSIGRKAVQEPPDHLALGWSGTRVRATRREIAIEDLGMDRPAEVAMEVGVVWPRVDSSLLDHRYVVTFKLSPLNSSQRQPPGPAPRNAVQ